MKAIQEIRETMQQSKLQTFRIPSYRCWIGFECWNDARKYAREINGETAFLKKKNGGNWMLHGKAFRPLLGADYNEDIGADEVDSSMELMAYHADVYTWTVAVIKH